jgi:sterol desaturase/sphingolipid hydroxylase (fatty acid hydroxylase superfamily)
VSLEIAAPAIIVGAALAFAALERLFPYHRGQRLFRDGFLVDLVGYTLLQSYVLALLIGILIRALDAHTGLSRLHLVSAWPLWVQVAFFVVTHDLYIYFFHRWQHASPLLWRLHEAHHSNTNVDWLAGARSHSLEILINQTIEFAPMVLLGAAPEVPLLKGAVSAVWGLYIHANLDVRTGRLQWILNGPEAHRWPHAIASEARDRNFATKFAFWDRLFGTAYLPTGRKPIGYGLPDVAFPTGYVAQHLFAFRRHRPDRMALAVIRSGRKRCAANAQKGGPKPN